MAAPQIIKTPTWGNNDVSLAKMLAVWATSALVNGILVAAFFLIFSFVDKATAGTKEEKTEIKTKNEVEDAPVEKDLTVTDIGQDATKELNYLNDNIKDVSVPGPVDVTAAPGIVNAEIAAPKNISPPPGSGFGTGMAPLDPNASGIGSMAGTAGGMGGFYQAGGYAGRSGSTRQKMRAEGGGTDASEAAVGLGLRWLALHQAADGHWGLHNFNRHYRTAPLGDPKGKLLPYNAGAEITNTTRNNDTAGTAFGLLPFLAAGITTKPSKDNVNKIDYSRGVKAAVEWMMRRQVQTSAERGYYGGDQYSHALATIAMCEAYGLTSDPRIKMSAQMGINYIVLAQHEGGGWRYSPKTAGDTSVTGWKLMALKSGQMAGLTVPKRTFKLVEAYLDSCESSDKGGYGYVPNSGESPAMTAVGALCRQYLGVNPRNKSLIKSVEKIGAVGPASGNLYFTYYATQVMHHMGGDAWDKWNKGPKGDGKGGVRDTFIAQQDKGAGGKAQLEGSFRGDDHVGGRLGATSLSLLSLEVYYRHLPLYRRDAGVMKPDK
ncbi:MAG: hypothetical protein K2W96_09475 [Gemmataceae bacterium]|nr:hypothetical protein [Gemmataceae bacterium]